MDQYLRAHLLACAAAFVATRGVTLSTLGRLAANDGQFFGRLEAGANFTARKYDDLVAWFLANWPPEGAMPTLAIGDTLPAPQPAFPVSSSIVDALPLGLSVPSQCQFPIVTETRIDAAFSGQPAGEMAVAG